MYMYIYIYIYIHTCQLSLLLLSDLRRARLPRRVRGQRRGRGQLLPRPRAAGPTGVPRAVCARGADVPCGHGDCRLPAAASHHLRGELGAAAAGARAGTTNDNISKKLIKPRILQIL